MILKERPNTCTIIYNDIKGNLKQEKLGQKKSRIVLHEYDHLEGLDLYSTGVIHAYQKLDELYDDDILKEFYEKENAKGYMF
jgi:peptide deformylase